MASVRVRNGAFWKEVVVGSGRPDGVKYRYACDAGYGCSCAPTLFMRNPELTYVTHGRTYYVVKCIHCRRQTMRRPDERAAVSAWNGGKFFYGKQAPERAPSVGRAVLRFFLNLAPVAVARGPPRYAWAGGPQTPAGPRSCGC